MTKRGVEYTVLLHSQSAKLALYFCNQDTIERGKRGKLTASFFLRCCFPKPFPRFPVLYVLVWSVSVSFCCLQWQPPFSSTVQLSCAMGLALPPGHRELLKPWALKKPSQCLNSEAVPSRSMVLSKGRSEFEGYRLCFQCIVHMEPQRAHSTSHLPLQAVSGHSGAWFL